LENCRETNNYIGLWGLQEKKLQFYEE